MSPDALIKSGDLLARIRYTSNIQHFIALIAKGSIALDPWTKLFHKED